MGTNPELDLAELVYRGVESEYLDYKSALNWTRMSRVAKAKIVRHCLALANTKGGCIVIGVGEDASGHPSVYTGLTPEEAHSFDPSTVGPFLHHHVEPAIDFTIERPVIDGKRYAIFVIRPFATLPHVCSCGIENELQTGVFYIRTSDASSRPAYRAIEMQQLIRRALRNQREELGRMLRGILYENRNVATVSGGGSAEDAFQPQLEHDRIFFRRRKAPPADGTSLLWDFAVIPSDYREERYSLSTIRNTFHEVWPSFAAAKYLQATELEKCYLTNVALRSFPEKELYFWQFYKSGLFHLLGWLPMPAGALPWHQLGGIIAGTTGLLGKIYAELGMLDEMLTIRIRVDNTEDTFLELPSGKRFECRIPEIEISMRRSAADLASGAVEHAARLAREVAERYNVPEDELRALPPPEPERV